MCFRANSCVGFIFLGLVSCSSFQNFRSSRLVKLLCGGWVTSPIILTFFNLKPCSSLSLAPSRRAEQGLDAGCEQGTGHWLQSRGNAMLISLRV